jgi:hypothetical protein
VNDYALKGRKRAKRKRRGKGGKRRGKGRRVWRRGIGKGLQRRLLYSQKTC